MHGVLIAMGAELFQLQSRCSVATVLFSSVARNPIGTLIGIAAALCTFQSDDETDAFCHDSSKCVNAVSNYYTS